MIRNKKAAAKASVLATAAALLLAACGGAGVDAEAAPEDASLAACGSYAIAMHAWVGYTASAQVITEVA